MNKVILVGNVGENAKRFIKKQMKNLMIIYFLLFSLTLLAQDQELQVGDIAPDFEGKTIYGKNFSLAKSMQKGEIVVLNFWFVACGACMAEIKHLRALHETYSKNKKIKFIGICRDEPANQKILQDFVKIRKFPYEHISHGKKIAEKYKIKAYPTNIIIKDGKVVYYSIGYNEDIHQKLEEIAKVVSTE